MQITSLDDLNIVLAALDEYESILSNQYNGNPETTDEDYIDYVKQEKIIKRLKRRTMKHIDNKMLE